jgi:hypothetical protein
MKIALTHRIKSAASSLKLERVFRIFFYVSFIPFALALLIVAHSSDGFPTGARLFWLPVLYLYFWLGPFGCIHSQFPDIRSAYIWDTLAVSGLVIFASRVRIAAVRSFLLVLSAVLWFFPPFGEFVCYAF